MSRNVKDNIEHGALQDLTLKEWPLSSPTPGPVAFFVVVFCWLGA